MSRVMRSALTQDSFVVAAKTWNRWRCSWMAKLPGVRIEVSWLTSSAIR